MSTFADTIHDEESDALIGNQVESHFPEGAPSVRRQKPSHPEWQGWTGAARSTTSSQSVPSVGPAW